MGEFCSREPILIPTHAQSIFAAHRAYRAGHGATDEDPFFTLVAERNFDLYKEDGRGGIRKI